MRRSLNVRSAMRLAMFVSALVGLPVATSLAAITVDPVANDVSPDPATWTNSTDAYIGKTADGELTVDGGSQIRSSSGYIGWSSGATGIATITGTGTQWNSGRFWIGGYGNSIGIFNIENGAEANSNRGQVWGGMNLSPAVGIVTITGASSKWNTTWLDVGYYGCGNGSVTIQNGGTLNSQNSQIGFGDVYTSTSTGNMTVTGLNSIWNNSQILKLGGDQGGTGALTVTNGGQVITKTLYASLSDLHGDGIVTVKSGAVLDTDLVFDETHGLTQQLAFGSGGKLNLTIDGTSELGAGYRGTGNLTIAGGQTVTSGFNYLGYGSDSTGTATITGNGSKLNTFMSFVGYGGKGILTIEKGGNVNSYWANIGYGPNSSGSAIVTGNNSRWSITGDLYVGVGGTGTLIVDDGGEVFTQTLHASLGRLHGSGTINANGAILDADLFFDSTHGLSQSLEFGSGGILNLTINGQGALGVGHQGTGTLRIADGQVVLSTSGYLGYERGSVGSAKVDGAGSKWTTSGDLCVGAIGTGELTITHGGSVASNYGRIGSSSGVDSVSIGTVRIDGTGSQWANSFNLEVGSSGIGKLIVARGGLVTAQSVSINNKSLLSMDIGFDSTLNINNGTGVLVNDGQARFTAGASVAAGEYQPILAGTFSGSGIYQTLGGTWDKTRHVFIVDAAETGSIDDTINLDLASSRRAAITDATSGQTLVGASFLSGTGSISFAADELTGSEESALSLMLTAGSDLLAGYQFTVTGTTIDSTNPVYLSLFVGRDYDEDTFKLWHYDGTAWTAFLPTDLSYDGLFASFTVTGFSGYAISGELIPEPASLGLLALSSVMLLMRRPPLKKQAR